MTITSETSLLTLLENHYISRRTYNGLSRAMYKTIGEVQIYAKPYSKLLRISNFGKKSLTEIIHAFSMIESPNGFTGNQHQISTFERMTSTLHPSYIVNLQNQYEELVSDIQDRRIQRIIQKHMPTIQAAVPFIDANLSQLMSIFRNRSMDGTLIKIQSFTNQLKNLLLQTSKKSLQEVSLENIKYDNPFFTESDCQFYYGFNQHYHYEPVLYKTYVFICQNQQSAFLFYRQYIGIETDVPLTISQVSSLNNCTYETVRRNIKRVISKSTSEFPFPMDLTGYTRLMSTSYVVESSPFYDQIRNREIKDISFRVLCHIITLFSHHAVIEIKNHYILLNRRILDVAAIKSMAESFSQLMKNKYPHDTPLDISGLLSEYPDKTMMNDICEIFDYICTQIYECKHIRGTDYIIKQNYIDIPNELYQILKNEGSPMKIEELFRRFKDKYPEHKYSRAGQIRSQLYRHPLIKPVGKKSTYGLTTWNKVFYGNIIDLVIKVLETSDRPLNLKEISMKVKRNFPDTKPKSIYTIMIADTKKRIVHYPNGYYGLNKKKS